MDDDICAPEQTANCLLPQLLLAGCTFNVVHDNDDDNLKVERWSKCLFVGRLEGFPSELSAAGTKRGVINLPIKSVLSRRST